MAKKDVKLTEEHKRKIAESMKGKRNALGHTKSEESKRIMHDKITGMKHTAEVKEMISKLHKGKVLSFETKEKMSIAKTGSKHPAWRGGISFGKYCPKFNNSIKKYIRDKYMNQCFLCGKTKEENDNRELDVHHIDYNKFQGCDEHEWRLVPLCRMCHSKTNHDRKKWERRIKIILEVIG